MARNRLREGFTTGTAATAAAKAALTLLLKGKRTRRVDVPLPREGRLTIPITHVAIGDGKADAVVIKDGGDDPDVTHKARIHAIVRFQPAPGPDRVVIEGGAGVGRVTRPGLPLPVGEWAINPAPRRQIEAGVREALKEADATGEVVVTVEVENGENIARKTLNPRLGILGGISILGTRGTVKPFSNRAYQDTITMSMDVARNQGLTSVALATGGKSERLLQGIRPDLPYSAWIQAGDFFAFSLREASKRGFESVLYASFFGKLIKMAQGHPYTHAGKSRIDFDELATWCASAGMDPAALQDLRRANTSREALGVIRNDAAADRILEDVIGRAVGAACCFLGEGVELALYLFDFDESLLKTHRTGPTVQRNKTP